MPGRKVLSATLPTPQSTVTALHTCEVHELGFFGNGSALPKVRWPMMRRVSGQGRSSQRSCPPRGFWEAEPEHRLSLHVLLLWRGGSNCLFAEAPRRRPNRGGAIERAGSRLTYGAQT